MIVPKFWAEGRVQQGIGRNQVTVRRYGWSDESPLNAQVNADVRAHEALARILLPASPIPMIGTSSWLA